MWRGKISTLSSGDRSIWSGVDQISGWAADPGSGEDPVEVQVFIDGRFHAAQRPVNPRPDLDRCRCDLDIRARVQLRSPELPRLSRGRHTINVFVVRKG
jgi:hypothetical protein